MQANTVNTTPDGCRDPAAWRGGFGVGHDGMDADHKRLFELFGELAAIVSDNRAAEEIERVLTELLEYTRSHFAREERLMREHAYPEFAKHKTMHDIFIRQIRDMSDALGSGGERGARVLGFLGNWLSGHILGVDRKLGAFLRERGVTA